MRVTADIICAQFATIMKKRIVLVIFMLILCLALGVGLCACNGRQGDDLTLETGSRPNYNSLFSADETEAINSALLNTATEEQKKSAVMALYSVANRSRLTTDTSLMLQSSDAGISLGDVIMHGFNLKKGDKWYYQLACEASSSNAGLNIVLENMAGLLKIAYTKGDGNFYYTVINGAAPKCECDIDTFPYATFVVTKSPTKYSEADFKTELHYLNGMHEINNMKFCAEIIADGAEITYNAEERFYKVTFSVDMNSDSALLEEWFALPKEDMAVGGQNLKKYEYYEAELEVWDNGYAKSFKSRSKRDAGLGSGAPTDGFEYIWNENEIMALLKEDAGIDEELHNMMHSIDDYIKYYSDPELTAERLSGLKIAGIVIGSVLGAALLATLIAVITVETLLKQGKLPKLAEKRRIKKEKKARKKLAKQNKGNVEEAGSQERPEQNEQAEGADISERVEQSEQVERAEQTDQTERIDQAEQPDQTGQTDQTEQTDDFEQTKQ